MGIVTVTPPAVFPVTTAEAKKQIEYPISLTDHDAHLDRLIETATKIGEEISKRAFINRTLRLTLDCFPSWRQGLPYPPLVSVSSIKYVDEQGVLQTLAATEYLVSTNNEPGFVEPAYNKTWPSSRREADAVRFEYLAGYGATGASVPAAAREGILLCVNTWFSHREAVVVGFTANEVPMNARWLFESLNPGRYPGWYQYEPYSRTG